MSINHNKTRTALNLMNMRAVHHFSYQSGTTLIEVLVAAIVLSVGLLGLAGLQATASKLNHSAHQRSQAASLAYEIVDAIRANAQNANDYDGEYGPSTCMQDMAISTSASSVAGNDLAEWENKISCALPGGSGTVDVARSGAITTLTVTLNWSEERTQTSSTALPEEDDRDEFIVVTQI